MVLPFKIITSSARETQKVGETLGITVPGVMCLWGELGSGKTTFVQGLAKSMGITSRLLSPTFIIVRRYDIPKTSRILYHLDLYRMQTEKDIDGLGFLEMVTDNHALVVVEWPERLGALLPKKRTDLYFAVLPNGNHEITIHHSGN